MNLFDRLWDAVKGNTWDDGFVVGVAEGIASGYGSGYTDGYLQAHRDAEQLVGHKIELRPVGKPDPSVPWRAEEC